MAYLAVASASKREHAGGGTHQMRLRHTLRCAQPYCCRHYSGQSEVSSKTLCLAHRNWRGVGTTWKSARHYNLRITREKYGPARAQRDDPLNLVRFLEQRDRAPADRSPGREFLPWQPKYSTINLKTDRPVGMQMGRPVTKKNGHRPFPS